MSKKGTNRSRVTGKHRFFQCLTRSNRKSKYSLFCFYLWGKTAGRGNKKNLYCPGNYTSHSYFWCSSYFPRKNLEFTSRLSIKKYSISFVSLNIFSKCRLKPTYFKSFISLLLARINKKLKLFWSPYVRIHISGLLCLLCQNTWFNSLSLQLSWIASMGMSNYRFSRFTSCALTFLLILPIVSQWGGSHPLSIILNWMITPLAACVLLPLSLLTIPFPILRFVIDEIWKYFLYGMNLFKPLMENRRIELTWSLSSFQIWIYICTCFILLHLYFVYSMRKDSETPIEQRGNYT